MKKYIENLSAKLEREQQKFEANDDGMVFYFYFGQQLTEVKS